MGRTKVLHEVLVMRFEEVYGRFHKADVRSRMSAPGGIAPWKAHEVRWSGMAATVELSQQPRTESCVVPGSPGSAAISEYAAHVAMRNNE